MAPTKKKKKPASNPARGFATVSLPSKAKVGEGASEAGREESEVENHQSIGQDAGVAFDNTQPVQESSSFQGMTADQLQTHFEDAELQNIVEKAAER